MGKTCALISFTSGVFPHNLAYVPTVFENYSSLLCVDSTVFKLDLWDTYALIFPHEARQKKCILVVSYRVVLVKKIMTPLDDCRMLGIKRFSFILYYSQ